MSAKVHESSYQACGPLCLLYNSKTKSIECSRFYCSQSVLLLVLRRISIPIAHSRLDRTLQVHTYTATLVRSSEKKTLFERITNEVKIEK